MSKIRRRPANHGKHVDPVEIRRRNENHAEGRRHENPVPVPESAPPPTTRRRRNAPAAGETMRLGGPAPDERPAAPAEHPPWTTAGDYLRGVAVEEAPARFGTPSGPVDDYARRVWRTAFGLAVRQRFEPGSPLAEISRTAAAAVHAHEAAGLPAIDVEMLIRAELGEQVPVDEFDPVVLTGVHLLVFASLVDELALGDGELDDLVTRAEQFAAGA
jgi:hypothetical protein